MVWFVIQDGAAVCNKGFWLNFAMMCYALQCYGSLCYAVLHYTCHAIAMPCWARAHTKSEPSEVGGVVHLSKGEPAPRGQPSQAVGQVWGVQCHTATHPLPSMHPHCLHQP